MVQVDVVASHHGEGKTSTMRCSRTPSVINPRARNLARAMGTRSAAHWAGLAPVEPASGHHRAFLTQLVTLPLMGEAESPLQEHLVKTSRTPRSIAPRRPPYRRSQRRAERDGRQTETWAAFGARRGGFIFKYDLWASAGHGMQ